MKKFVLAALAAILLLSVMLPASADDDILPPPPSGSLCSVRVQIRFPGGVPKAVGELACRDVQQVDIFDIWLYRVKPDGSFVLSTHVATNGTIYTDYLKRTAWHSSTCGSSSRWYAHMLAVVYDHGDSYSFSDNTSIKDCP